MATTTQPALAQVKSRQRATWASGDYGKVAWLTVPLADWLCDAVDLRAGSRVLDVATGTGHAALAAGRRFCDATGVDYVPALLETARRRAEAEGLGIEFREGDAERLPFDDGSFDYVLSAIGVMFTADHARAARELTRVCRPGGTIGVTSWTPDGFVGRLLAAVGRYAPPPAGVQPPVRWGTEEYVRGLLADRVSRLSTRLGAVTMRFRSPEHFADFFLANYGPTLSAAKGLDDDGRGGLRGALADLARDASRTSDGPVAMEWEHMTAVAVRTA